MKRAVPVVALLVLAAARPAVAQTDPVPSALPSLDAVQWAGTPGNFETLRGKTVVVLVYASWCPKCNAWSGQLFTQLKEAIHGQPVVVLAINADESPAGAERYLNERGFFAPNILHGYDPGMAAQLGFQSNLYNYVLIDAEGKFVRRGSAGSFREQPEGRQFVLAAQLRKRAEQSRFKVLSTQMSPEVQQVLWPLEFGSCSEAELRQARSKLTPDQQQELGTAVARFLDAEIEQIRQLYYGDLSEKLQAFEKASTLSTMFKATKQSNTAKRVVAQLNSDKQFKRELAAKTYYERTQQQIAAQPARRAALLRTVARRCPGTHFGDVAQQEAEAGAP